MSEEHTEIHLTAETLGDSPERAPQGGPGEFLGWLDEYGWSLIHFGNPTSRVDTRPTWFVREGGRQIFHIRPETIVEAFRLPFRSPEEQRRPPLCP